MGLGRLNEEVRDACSRDKSAKPPVSRPLRIQTSYVFAPLALRGAGDSSSIKRQLRTAANDVHLFPMFRDLT